MKNKLPEIAKNSLSIWGEGSNWHWSIHNGENVLEQGKTVSYQLAQRQSDFAMKRALKISPMRKK